MSLSLKTLTGSCLKVRIAVSLSPHAGSNRMCAQNSTGA